MFKIIKKINVSKFQENLAKKDKNVILTKEINTYEKPVFTPLTKKEIDAIHARGHITQKEKVKEWENLDLCAPGDAIGSAASRCRKFKYNCHDCLVDYSLRKLEYESLESFSKLYFQPSSDNVQKVLKKD